MGFIIALLLILGLLQAPHGNLIYACGLFAFIGDNPTKYFSWDKFNTLGLFNDERGGDACGRVVGNRVMWGVDKLKKYEEFASEVAPNPLHVKDNVVLGHCRKASSGGKADIYAQPVVLFKIDVDLSQIKNKDMLTAIETMKDTDIVFSGIHNGTIDNYLDLADKYKISTDNHNDSRVLLSILFYEHYSVLKEYIGTAALVWHNHILNKSYIFKGESKSWSTSAVMSEERPLFAWVVAENNYYISSLVGSLKFIQTKKSPVIEIRSNTLYKFTSGVSNKSVKYDRSSSLQNKVYESKSNYNNESLYRGGCSFNRGTKSLKEYNDAYDRYEKSGKFIGNDSGVNYEAWGEDVPWEQRQINYKIGDRHIRQFSINNQEGFRIAFEKSDKFDSRSLKKAVYNKTRYWMNGNLMHGVYVLSQGGIVSVNSYAKGLIVLKPYYFVEGVMMDGVQAYNAALKLHEDFMSDIIDILLDNQFTEEQFTHQIAKYSRFPVVPLLNNSHSECCLSPINMGPDIYKNLFTGEYQPLFSFRKYKFQAGELYSVEEAKTQRVCTHDILDEKATSLYLATVKASSPQDWVYSVGSNLLNLDGYKNPMSPFQKYLVETCDIHNTKLTEESIFLINYLRDFNVDMIDDCKICTNEDTTFIRNCLRCTKLTLNFSMIKTRKYYELYD